MTEQRERSSPTILVVDDEESLLDAISYSFRREGWTVETAVRGEDAVRMATEIEPDLVVLDVMLPGLDGIQVCRSLRSVSTVPIVFLSARGEDVDRILGLEIGADDYLTKPFVMRELVARVRANLRRAEALQRENGVRAATSRPDSAEQRAATPDVVRILRAGEIELDTGARTVVVRSKPIQLKPKEFDLLAYLMAHPGVSITRETLLRDVWNYAYTVDTRTVDVHIRGLRRKLESESTHPGMIETVRGHGYRLRANGA